MLDRHQVQSTSARAWQDIIEQVQAAWSAGDYDRAYELYLGLQDRATPWLLTIARARGPADRAEEFVAQAYVDLLEKIQTGQPITRVKGLLGTIVRRRIIDALRRGAGVTLESAGDGFWEIHADSSTSSPEQDEFESVDMRETARQVANAILDVLPEPEREVLIARHLLGLSVEEVAVRLGLTEDQVKKRTQRGIRLARGIAQERGLCHDFC